MAAASPGAQTAQSSEPPDVAPRVSTVQQLGVVSNPTNPVFERAAGRWTNPTPTQQQQPRFEGLSAATLEADGFGFRDAAEGDSVLFSDTASRTNDPEIDAAARRAAATSSRKRKARQSDSRAKADARSKSAKSREAREDDDDSDSDEDDGIFKSKKDKKSKAESIVKQEAEDVMAQAAFGDGAAARCDEQSQAGSVKSERSSVNRRAAECAAFPIPTIECVGCSLGEKIDVVTQYVLQNINGVGDDALWKQASLVYRRAVQEPRLAEDVFTPSWSWKDLRLHYLVHSNNDFIARATTCRQLQTLRHAYSLRLVRVENGERELDRANADFLLKVVNAESRERQLMAAVAPPPAQKQSTSKDGAPAGDSDGSPADPAKAAPAPAPAAAAGASKRGASK